ncbi:MAG: hypothetical protein Q9170_003980 [Blastenia crenularia]
MTPEEHQQEFLYQASKLGLEVTELSNQEIARAFINAPVDKIRSLNYCGAPCSSSELIPQPDWATMQHARNAKPSAWLKSQVLCSSTYDGSVSYLVAKWQERKGLGRIFAAICRAKLKHPQRLLDLYQISDEDDDNVALQRICQVVTDIGFYGAAVSGLLGASKSAETRSYLMLFDIGNPNRGLLEKKRFATHTWDIVSLLGPYDNLGPDDIKQGIFEWRQNILTYCYTGGFSCEPWQTACQTALLVRNDGTVNLDHNTLTNCKAYKLLALAEQEGGEHGCDMIWENVVRFFLKTGNPRYNHEVSGLMAKYGQDSVSET